MVKRMNWRRYAFLAFAIIVLILSWETNLTNAAVVKPEIPEQSIRLRILANSDTARDQAVKRRVRDAIIAEMNGWVTGPATIEQAREIVRSKLPELNAVVGQELANSGFSYGYQVELGVVPFPAKMYGDKVYPAGDYEALRVVLGKGEGQNWWCVLFPPLCFVDVVTGETGAASDKQIAANGDNPRQAEIKIESKREVRFFFWEKLKSWFA